MKLIYRCLQCAQQVEKDAPGGFTHFFATLNEAYQLKDPDRKIKTWDMHPCAPDIVGVAQLVGVRCAV